MNWSSYQIAVYDAFENSDRNLLINAVAGSGKSTVIEEMCRRTSVMDEVLACAFNRHIRDALVKKLPKYIDVRTLNGWGWSIYRRYVPNVCMDTDKDRNWLKSQIRDERLYWSIQGPVSRLVGLFKHLNIVGLLPENWLKICDDYGIDVPESDELIDWLHRTWAWSTTCLDVASFDDQIYQPVANNWRAAKKELTLVDETQDLSPCQIALVLSSGDRIISVGDPRQAIYVFRGADQNAVDNVITATNAVELPLSVCYRCPTSVVEMAKKYVPHIEVAPNASEGEVVNVNRDQFWEQVRDNDYVLCRNSAPLVEWCLEAIRRKRKAFVRGRDIGEQLIGTIKKIGSVETINDFVIKTQRWRTTQVERLSAAGREAMIQQIDDRVETLLVLAEDCDRVEDLLKMIDRIFSDQATEGIEFSTIHKSKGGQRERVWRLQEYLCPHPKTPEHLLQIEYNLKYVEVTRSQNFLGTIR